jgi:hypothetical protein
MRGRFQFRWSPSGLEPLDHLNFIYFFFFGNFSPKKTEKKELVLILFASLWEEDELSWWAIFCFVLHQEKWLVSDWTCCQVK